MTLGERIQKSREDKGLSQRRLAELVSLRIAPELPPVLQGTVSKWEAIGVRFEGDRPKWVRPKLEHLEAIAEACDVDLGWLVAGREPSPPPAPLPSDELFILDLYRDLGLTREQAVRGLSWAAAQSSSAPPAEHVIAVRKTTEHKERLMADRERQEREAARARQGAKSTDPK